MELPFDGAISAFFAMTPPEPIRNAIRRADSGDILDPGYPHSERLPRKHYEKELEALQIELAKMQSWAKDSGARIAIVFEVRDAAGKGRHDQALSRISEPARRAACGALQTDRDRGDAMVFPSATIDHLPAGGDIVFYDRSWYNRAASSSKRCSASALDSAREHFFDQTPGCRTECWWMRAFTS